MGPSEKGGSLASAVAGVGGGIVPQEHKGESTSPAQLSFLIVLDELQWPLNLTLIPSYPCFLRRECSRVLCALCVGGQMGKEETM